MVSSTDGIGRLIADEVLLQADRQLLRGREQSSQQSEQKPAAHPNPAPISHNEKAVASVLLTLLDEQLDAAANPKLSQGFAPEASAGEAPPASRIGSQYAEADAAFRPDVPTEPSAFSPNTINHQFALAAASPELRIAMQSAFLSAAVRAQTEMDETSSGKVRRQGFAGGANSNAAMRIGAIIAAGLVLALVLAAGLAK